MEMKKWKKRIAERSDMTTKLVHLTKPADFGDNKMSCLEVLIKIIKEKRLEGSTTESGFIVGSRKAVCFQDTPLYSLAQNVYYEQKLKSSGESKKIRYYGWGLIFDKKFIYKNNGRPVIYDNTLQAKEYLPDNQWWRIVNLDLSDENNIIDWTHEREWRVPEYLDFKLEDISIIVPNHKNFKKVIKEFDNIGIDILNEVRSIINLGDLFY